MIRRKLTDKNNGIDDKNNNRQFNMEQGKRKTEDVVKTLLNEEEGHEGLAKELLKLTSSLKNNFSTAGSVLKDDNAALDVMQRVASTNKENLIRESERLRHHAYESCFNCMMIMTVIFVIWSFIAMIILIRYEMRIGLNFRFRPTFIQKRLLSANEAAIALRPFYFAVHPDRFAREPDLQTSNEKALQVFNGYLNNLFPSNHDNQPPVQIEFAVKDKDNNLKQIRLFLSGFDADHIVRLTLEKCNLSTENLPRGGQKNDKAYLSNFRQWKTEGLDEIWQNLQENERIRRKQYSVDHLFKGIANIRELAIQRMENHKRMAEMIKDLIEGIQRKTGVTQILWSINWELSFMRRCLINISAMLNHAEKDSRENIVNALNGRRLSFGRGSFICCDGSLQFGADDAEGAWQKICLESTVRRFDLRNLELLVGRVQDLLGGVQLIVKPLGNILLTIQHMQIFIGRVCSQPATEKSKLRSLLINTNQQVEIVNNYCELTILDGCLQIPCNVDFNSLKHFIAANNATTADQQRREYYAQKCLLESAKEESAKYLNLLSLTWDGNLSFPLVLHCLRKLGQIDPNQVANFSNLEIHISSSQKIVVFSNGKISIPLEWIEKL